jgi:hypothetical protein
MIVADAVWMQVKQSELGSPAAMLKKVVVPMSFGMARMEAAEEDDERVRKVAREQAKPSTERTEEEIELQIEQEMKAKAEAEEVKMVEHYGEWQTEPYTPPVAVDGKVPKNKYGMY